MHSVKDIAERYDVTQHTVIAWIQSGDLKAVDVSRRRGGKPHWRISTEALEAFEFSRMPIPPAPKSRRRKRDADVIEFY